MALQSLDIIRRSATTTPSPGQRRTMEVAKLIDVSKCIGCKACQVACMEWNDTRDAVGHNHGVYDNPTDLTADSWTVMRYAEVETDRGLEWLICKDGCMHCSEPGCLRACPAPWCNTATASWISTRRTASAPWSTSGRVPPSRSPPWDSPFWVSAPWSIT